MTQKQNQRNSRISNKYVRASLVGVAAAIAVSLAFRHPVPVEAATGHNHWDTPVTITAGTQLNHDTLASKHPKIIVFPQGKQSESTELQSIAGIPVLTVFAAKSGSASKTAIYDPTGAIAHSLNVVHPPTAVVLDKWNYVRDRVAMNEPGTIPAAAAQEAIKLEAETIHHTTKTNAEWKTLLTPAQYEILRNAGTEPAFTGKYWNNHKKGSYRCAACGNLLFSSDTKFESGTGWPSFYAPVSSERVSSRGDSSFGMDRTEVVCAQCGGHLGHVFNDGPAPTGLRYCMNSDAMIFEPAK